MSIHCPKLTKRIKIGFNNSQIYSDHLNTG